MTTRRLFLLGSVAAITAAAMPAAIALPSPSDYLVRLVQGFRVCFDPAYVSNEIATVNVMWHEQLQWHYRLNPHTFLNWVSAPGEELVIFRRDPVRVWVDDCQHPAQIQIDCVDVMEDGRRVRTAESHRIAANGMHTVSTETIGRG